MNKDCQKIYTKKPKYVTSHVFAEITHLVAARRYVDLHVWSHFDVVIYSKFHRNLFGGLGPLGVEICPFLSLWLLTFTTACTTVQAEIGLLPRRIVTFDFLRCTNAFTYLLTYLLTDTAERFRQDWTSFRGTWCRSIRKLT